MIISFLLLLLVSCFSGYWDFLRTPRTGRLAHKMTVFVSNKTCSEDFILAGSDDADSINACKNSCINHEQCTAFTFLSRHNRNIEVIFVHLTWIFYHVMLTFSVICLSPAPRLWRWQTAWPAWQDSCQVSGGAELWLVKVTRQLMWGELVTPSDLWRMILGRSGLYTSGQRRDIT